MADPNLSPSHPVVDSINAGVKGLPWAKITAPMVPAVAGLWYLGDWLKNIYSINMQNHITNAFPDGRALWTFMIGGLGLVSVYLGLSIWHLGANIKNIK